jgi:hypothetical protein
MLVSMATGTFRLCPRSQVAVESFKCDVLDCGVPAPQAEALEERYVRALESGAHVDWIELYVGIFATLMRDMHRTRLADASAARAMLQLVNDDLGCELFDWQARAGLACALHAHSEGGAMRSKAVHVVHPYAHRGMRSASHPDTPHFRGSV